MGAKILPGTPVIVNNGTKATMMMVVAKKMGRPTSRAALVICIGTVMVGLRLCARWEKILSTMMSVESTMMPKSMAPREIRLAESPSSTSRQKVNNRARGTVRATIIAVRTWPKNT